MIFPIIFQRRALFVDNFYTYTQVDEYSYLIFILFSFSVRDVSFFINKVVDVRRESSLVMDSGQLKCEKKGKISHIYEKVQTFHLTGTRAILYFSCSLYSMCSLAQRAQSENANCPTLMRGAGNADVDEIYDCTQLIRLYCYSFFVCFAVLLHSAASDTWTTSILRRLFSNSFWLSRSLCNFHSLTPQAL